MQLLRRYHSEDWVKVETKQVKGCDVSVDVVVVSTALCSSSVHGVDSTLKLI